MDGNEEILLQWAVTKEDFGTTGVKNISFATYCYTLHINMEKRKRIKKTR